MIRRPNLILFNPDQWRGDVMGHLGDPAAVTPHTDRLVAESAVSFRTAVCQNPVCTPSRCSFMSGWYPHVRGHRTMFHMMRPDEPVLLRTLKDLGYHVWWGGKNDLVPAQTPDAYGPYSTTRYGSPTEPMPSVHALAMRPEVRGEPGSDTYYSFYVGRIDTEGREHHEDGDWLTVSGAVEVLADPPPEPWCLFLALGTPHPPYGVEDPWYSQIDRAALPPRAPVPDWADKPSILRGLWETQGMRGWTEERWTELRATYYGMVARTDHLFGRVLDALRASGAWDETAVFLFSDHGDFTGDYGLVEKTQNTFLEGQVRVPLVVKPPAWAPVRPRVTEALAELIDVPATIEALAGIEPGHTHFGRSLLAVLAGETETHRDAVFSEGGRLRGERQCMELESTSSQNPEGLYYPRMALQRSESPAHGKAAMCRTDRYKYVRRLYETDELYDLAADPREQTNRIADPALAEVRADLQDRMLTWMQETADAVPVDTDRRW